MPKYTRDKIGGYYLYFTSKCVIEAMHAHASDKKLTEKSSAKFFVREDGSIEIARKGRLSAKSISLITEYIRLNYKEMYQQWVNFGGTEFYRGN